jgi:hypothetical protein
LRILAEKERQARDHIAGVAHLAKQHLDNALWRVSCLRDDVDQLGRAANPPPLEHRPEVVKRPKPQLGDYDPIVMPAAERAA